MDAATKPLPLIAIPRVADGWPRFAETFLLAFTSPRPPRSRALSSRRTILSFYPHDVLRTTTINIHRLYAEPSGALRFLPPLRPSQ